MSIEAVKTPDGQTVYPSGAAAIIDDTKAVFDDDLYSSLKNPAPVDNPTPETPSEPLESLEPLPPAAQAEETLIDYNSIIKEKTGGKYESWESIQAKLDQAEKGYEFKNEDSRKLAEAISEGREEEVLTYLYQKNLLSNADKLTPADQVKLKMQLENPDWSSDDISDEFEKQFGLSVDEDASEVQLAKEKRAIERRLGAAAKEAVNYLSEMKKEIVLDVKKPDDKSEYYTQLETTKQENDKLNELFLQAVDKDISDFKTIDLSFTDKDVQFNHQFNINESEKAELANTLKEGTFLSRYYKDGQWQTKELLRNEYIVKNLDKIVKSAVTKAMTEAALGKVKSIANYDSPKPSVLSSDLQAEAEMASLRRAALA